MAVTSNHSASGRILQENVQNSGVTGGTKRGGGGGYGAINSPGTCIREGVATESCLRMEGLLATLKKEREAWIGLEYPDPLAGQ